MNFLLNGGIRKRVMTVIDNHPVPVLIGIFLYIVSPIDLLPEAFLGPLGTFDDILAAIAGLAIIKAMLKKRAAQRQAAPASPAPMPPAPPSPTPPRSQPPRRDERTRRNDRRPRHNGQR